jgi:fatty-acid peroxygenase
LDRTLALAFEGYGFGLKRFTRAGADAFETRLLLERTICARGPEACRVFYR